MVMNHETSSALNRKEISTLLDHPDVDDLIRLALKEDGIQNDLTTACCDKSADLTTARVVVKSPTVIAGGPLVARVLKAAGVSDVQIAFHLEEGHWVDTNSVSPAPVWFELKGPMAQLLKTERTILNFLIRICGIATVTQRIVKDISETSCRLLHTRKTAPGHRRTDIYACLMGGAHPHRRSLDDAILVKENHIRSSSSWQTLGDGIEKNRKLARFVEIEVTNMMELKHALALKPDRIMLDNFSIKEIEKAVLLFGSAVELEASGGINATNAREYALTGVDYISLGSLTHSAPAADLSMLFL